MRLKILGVFVFVAFNAYGHAHAVDTSHALNTQTLADTKALDEAISSLAIVAEQKCETNIGLLFVAFEKAVDSWMAVSHLQFGSFESGSLRYEIAFWPDPRSKINKALRKFLSDPDPNKLNPTNFSTESVAIKGLYAMEYLLYEPSLTDDLTELQRCKIILAIARDMSRVSGQLAAQQKEFFHAIGDVPLYKDYYKSLIFGLEQTSKIRFGMPLGTADRPQPLKAEMRRSGRTKRHIELSLIHLSELTRFLTKDHHELNSKFRDLFTLAIRDVTNINDPTLSGVSEPETWFKFKEIQTQIVSISLILRSELGPKLGVTAGFNASDGD